MPEFHELWYPAQSCKAVRRLVDETRGLPGRVIEVGAWEGMSTVSIAHGAWPTVVDVVDTWDGSPGEISGELAQTRDVYATFLKNMSELTRGNIEPHRMGWRDYFAQDRGPIRFLHIDAEHTYREVHDTIQTALPLVVSGGMIVGDDAHHPPVMDAVYELLEPVAITATLWAWRAP